MTASLRFKLGFEHKWFVWEGIPGNTSRGVGR